MADNFTDFYTGNMAPPLKLPGGGYAPAPSLQPQMTPEEIYQGIYGEPISAGLSTRTVKTVPVPMSVSGSAEFGAGAGVRNSGSADYRAPKVWQPNPVPGPDPVAKYEDRLPALPAGLPLASDVPGYASARGSLGAGGFGSGAVTALPRMSADPVHQLNVDVADAEGQMYADNLGMPVRGKSGKVYQPQQAFTPKALSDVRATAPKVTAQRGLLATLLGGLGGGQAQPQRLGNLLSGIPHVGAAQAAASPSPGYVTTPFQEDRFQTTTGAVMPSSMSNSRWTTGY